LEFGINQKNKEKKKMATVKINLSNVEIVGKMIKILQEIIRDERVAEEVRQEYNLLIEYVLNGGDGSDGKV